ncbi:MAG: MarR family transcriptional regulator, partial [Polyangiaceae bacterium]
MTAPKQPSAEPAALDLGYLSLFVGLRINELVLDALLKAGFAGIRHAHGYVFQHLLPGPLAISELARHLGVTQQAA